MEIKKKTQKGAPVIDSAEKVNVDQTFDNSVFGMFEELGVSLQVGQDTLALHEGLMMYAEPTVQQLAQRGIQLKSGVILSNANGTSRLAYDTILLVLRVGQKVAIAPVLVKENVIHEKLEIPVVQYDANLNPTQYEDVVQIDRFPSESDDDVFRNAVTDHAMEILNVTGEQLIVTVMPPRVWYPDNMDGSEERLKSELRDLLQNAILTVEPSHSNPATCRKLTNMTAGANKGLAVTIGGYQGDPATTLRDELGRMTMPTASISINQLTHGSSEGDTIHRGGKTINLGLLGIRTEVMWIGSPFTPNGMYPEFITPEQPNLNGFAPNVIIEDIASGAMRLEDLLLSLGVTYQMMNEGIVKTSFDPATLGVLNISANLKGDKDPAPLDSKTMNAEFDLIYNQFMRQSAVNFSIVLRMGGSSINTTRFLNNKDVDNEIIVRQALDNMTGNTFSNSFAGNIFNTEIEPEPYLIGTYTAENGEVRPLSEIGLQQIMTMGYQQREAIRYWVESQSNAIDRNTSIALKLKALNTVSLNYQLDEVYTMVTLNPEVLRWLSTYITSHGLIKSTNMMQVQATQVGWGVNRMASGLTTFHGAQAPMNNMMGQQGQIGPQVVQTAQGPMIFDPVTNQLSPVNGQYTQPVR